MQSHKAKPSEKLLEKLEYSTEYAEYINQCTPIGNGDQLICAIESGKYWEGFLNSIGIDPNDLE